MKNKISQWLLGVFTALLLFATGWLAHQAPPSVNPAPKDLNVVASTDVATVTLPNIAAVPEVTVPPIQMVVSGDVTVHFDLSAAEEPTPDFAPPQTWLTNYLLAKGHLTPRRDIRPIPPVPPRDMLRRSITYI